MTRGERFLDGAVPVLFVLIGLGMIALAAWENMGDSVAITFAVLGAGLVCLGGILRNLQGAVELGPQGFKAQIRERKAAVVGVLGEANRPLADALDQIVAYLMQERTTGAFAPPSRVAPLSTNEPDSEGPYIKGPYVKGPALILPNEDGSETLIDIEALEQAARDDDEDDPGAGVPAKVR